MANSLEETNEDLFKIHDAHTQQLHQKYLEHLRLEPKLKQKNVREEIERQSKEEFAQHIKEKPSSNKDEINLKSPDNGIVKAIEERDAVENAQNKIKRKRLQYQIFSIIGSLMLSSGAAILIGPNLGSFLPFLPPKWLSSFVMVVVLSSLTSLIGWHAAKLRQIMQEQKIELMEINEIALIEPILKIERKLTNEEKLIELKKFAQDRWENKKYSEIMLELQFNLVGLGFLIILQIIFGLYQFIHSSESIVNGILTGSFISLFGSVFLVMNLLPLSSKSLDIPNIPEYNVIDPKEIERKYEEEKKNKKIFDSNLEKENKEHLSKEIETKIKNSEKETKELFADTYQEFSRLEEKIYQDLRVATGKWEELRHFNQKEISHMTGLRNLLNRRMFWLLYPISIISALLATYPASIFTSEAMDIGFIYTTMGKVSPVVWAIWTMLMIGAEFLIVTGFTNISKFNYYREVLLQNYDMNLRKKGMTYTVLRKNDAKRQSIGSKFKLALGIVILSIELVANVLYLKQQAVADISIFTFVISLVPFLLLIGFAFITAEHKYQLFYLNDALGYGVPENNTQRKASDSYSVRNSETRRELDEIERNIGPRHINAKKPNKLTDKD